jgi:hypothetical protein
MQRLVEVVDVMERVTMEWALIGAAMQHLTDMRDTRGGSNELRI